MDFLASYLSYSSVSFPTSYYLYPHFNSAKFSDYYEEVMIEEFY